MVRGGKDSKRHPQAFTGAFCPDFCHQNTLHRMNIRDGLPEGQAERISVPWRFLSELNTSI